MSDPVTLAALEGVALTEGVKFLYKQAGELLKWWLHRKKAPPESTPAAPPVLVLPSSAFEGQLSSPTVDEAEMRRNEEVLRRLRADLLEYADGTRDSIDVTDRTLLEQIDALRQALESVFGQRVTFKGEHRAPSGTVVTAKATVGVVDGKVTVIDADEIRDVTVHAEGEATKIEKGAEFTVIKAGTIGKK